MRWILPGMAALLLAVSGACGPDDPDDPSLAVRELVQGLGEPVGGFPSWEERVVLVWTNRARSDPSAEVAESCSGGSCSTYPASKPLYYNYNLGRAARFQATSLKTAGSGLMHDSVCQLVSNLGSIYPSSCDGSPSCACVGGAASCTCSGTKPFCTCSGGACTSTWGRIGLFGVQGTGENAAAGSTDPIKTFQQWVKSSGHWSNINTSSHGSLGTGYYGGAGGCWSAFWVQVFSYGSSTPKLVSGVHYPKVGSTGGQVAFKANYYDPTGDPKDATVNINGTCYKMTLERGTATVGATYSYTHTFSLTGCLQYYFYFKDAGGTVVSFPTTGSYGVGVQGGTCADYSSTARPKLGTGCGCTTSADCNDGNACTSDACSSGQCQNTTISGCCTADSQCDDKNVCTKDSCSSNKCSSTPISGCCTTVSDCNDGNICTTDACSSNKCTSTPISGCCTKSSDCNDGKVCTTDTCVSGKCQYTTISGCCTTDSQCDDASSCTTDACSSNKCTSTATSGCCTKDTDCKDNNPCTSETCLMPQGTCSFQTSAGCCAVDTDCNDANPCTRDTCDTAQRTCRFAAISGCGNDAGASSADGGGITIPSPGASGLELSGGCSTAPVGGQQSLPTLLLWLVLAVLLARRRAR